MIEKIIKSFTISLFISIFIVIVSPLNVNAQAVESIEVGIGALEKIEAPYYESTYSPEESVTWISSNTEIAAVEDSGCSFTTIDGVSNGKVFGTIFGLSRGECNIYVRNNADGQILKLFTVKVGTEEQEITVCKDSMFAMLVSHMSEVVTLAMSGTSNYNIHTQQTTQSGVNGQYTYQTKYYASVYDSGNYIVNFYSNNELVKLINLTVLDHQYDSGTITYAPTCINDGIKTYTCQLCNSQKEEIVPSVDHSWNNYLSQDINPTCTEDGSCSIHCNYCGTIKEGSKIIIPFPGHIWDIIETIDKNATCKEEGEMSIHCGICSSILEGSQKRIPIVPHDLTEWKVESEASCISEGEKVRYCRLCNDTEKIAIPALGHKWYIEPIIDTPPTCTEEGKQSIHCSLCYTEKENSEEIIPKTPHEYSEWRITTDATCIKEGEEVRFCNICEIKEHKIIPLLGHRWDLFFTVDQPSTCTVEGIQSIHCNICGSKNDSTTEKIQLLPHEFGYWQEFRAATCTEEGAEKRKCEVCDKSEIRAISINPHIWAWNNNYTIDKEATCNSDGEASLHCIICDAKNWASIIRIPETNEHQFLNWYIKRTPTIFKQGIMARKCKVCNIEETQHIPKLSSVVKLNENNITIQLKKSTTALKINYYDDNDRVYRWKSSNPKIAAVNSKTGKITAKKPGITYITVTMRSGASASCKIRVQKGVVKTKEIKVTYKKKIKAKSSYTLKISRSPVTANDELIITSSNKKVLTVTNKGKMKAIKKGKSTITIKTKGGINTKIKIKVV